MPERKSQNKQQELRIVSKPPTVVADGHALLMNNPESGDLIFLQIRNKQSDMVEAEGVASIRLNLDQLRALSRVINEAVSEQETQINKQKVK